MKKKREPAQDLMNKEEYLLPGERLDDLQRNGLYIIQHPDRFCFGMDAVLLSGFVSGHIPSSGGKLLDLCTGNGIIPLLVSAKTDVDHITGMEIQPAVADMAQRSVRMNSLTDRIEILACDIRDAERYIKPSSFDIVTVNPPYFKAGCGIINPRDSKTISRHEVACTLNDVLDRASMALRDGGLFFMVHRPQRLTDIVSGMRHAGIEPKILKTVHPRLSSKPSMVLISGRKGAGAETDIEPPLIIYGEDGRYTEEMYTIYGY